MKINLRREFFTECEHELLKHGRIRITAFKYQTGVEALRIENERGYFIFLPFLGQQIWRINFDGRDLAMNTSVKEPVYTNVLMENYGAFLYHCGMTACGVPQDEDDHPQHGELPNIVYRKAHIRCDEDEKGRYIAVGGELEYNMVYSAHYVFCPEVKLYENDAHIRVTVSLKNLRNTDMEYMYLCHINYLPIDGAELIYSAPKDREHIKVHRNIAAPASKEKWDKLLTFMDAVEENPELHHIIGGEETCFDPEMCFTVLYEGDENNRAYTMQYKRGEGACFVNHPTDALPRCVRWISRTEDEDTMGMVLPASAEHLGRDYARRNGYMKHLAPGETVEFYMETGWISDSDARAMEKKINDILEK